LFLQKEHWQWLNLSAAPWSRSMTDPTPLSPAAQGVWEAFNQDEAGVFVDYGDKLAAALRAAADQVVPPQQETPWGSIVQAHAAELRIRNELLAIAAELEGVNG
jgi:hypothetical protein